MIHNQRLEKYVHNKEWQKDNQSVLEIYNQMTPEQRAEIKQMLERNRLKSY